MEKARRMPRHCFTVTFSDWGYPNHSPRRAHVNQTLPMQQFLMQCGCAATILEDMREVKKTGAVACRLIGTDAVFHSGCVEVCAVTERALQMFIRMTRFQKHTDGSRLQFPPVPLI